MNSSKFKPEIDKVTDQVFTKLKDLKTWVQVKGPKSLRPALSYALDWLSPELMGTGLRFFEVSDYQLKAVIPANKTNLNFDKQIHQGLVVNSALEMTRLFLKRQMPSASFQIAETHIELSKNLRWTEDLELIFKANEVDLDDLFVQLNKFKKSKFQADILICLSEEQNKQFKKYDHCHLTIKIEMIDLLG